MTLFQGEVQLRCDTSANWAAANTVLGLGEPGWDSTVDRLKMGDGATAWNTLAWATDAPFIPPPSTGWTAMNGPAITADLNGRFQTYTAGAADNWKGEYRTLSPVINYTATTHLTWTSAGQFYFFGGLILKNSGGTSFIHYGLWAAGTSPPALYLGASKWTSVSAFSAEYAKVALGSLPGGVPNWLRVRDDGTNRYFEFSYDRYIWATSFSVGRTDFLTPDQIGWAMSSNNAAGANTVSLRLKHLEVA